jgi:hypothetical protein
MPLRSSGLRYSVAAGIRTFTRLIVPENANSFRSRQFSTPRKKISEPPVISPVARSVREGNRSEQHGKLY